MLKWDTMIEFNMEQTEDGLRLQVADLQMDNERLIKELHTERDEREAAACNVDDAQREIKKLQMTIDQYEEASLR